MKTSAEKSSTTTSPTATQTASQPFFAKAGAGSFFAPAKTAPAIQAKLAVNKPGDSFEQQADQMAANVMRMPTPAAPLKEEKLQRQPDDKLRKKEEEKVQKAPAGEEKLQRESGAGTPVVSARVQSAIQNKTTGGQPLAADVRSFMEPRFHADFRNIRVHTDAESASLNNQLSARAFTYQNHIFFARDQYQPGTSSGQQLLAHELTHTIQQGHAIQRSPQVSTTTTPPSIQRLGLDDVLDGLAALAANVPGFTLLTLIIGRNPINMRVVERTVVNVLRAFMGLIPGGEILFQVLNRYGVMQRLGEWVNQQTATLGLSFETIRTAFTQFTDSLSWTDIFSPGDVWRRAQNIFTPIITRIQNFVGGLITQAITWLKETFMQPLSDFCREIPGYTLVTVVLGRDPFTNAPVARTALNVVRAFAEFIPGGTEKVNQLVESRGLERAYEWFVTETQARNLTWTRVVGTFSQAWNSLRLEDVLSPIETLQRVGNIFRPLMSDLVSFAGAALMKLLEFIYEAAMGAGGTRILAILTRARATFLTIIQNPVGFLRNLLGAVGQGVRQFMGNILRHLQQGVIGWLTGPVARAGIQMPEQWDLRGILWFVMQILGLTWDRIRQKLVRLMGERAVAALETSFQLIQDIRARGLVQTLRDRVTEFFGQLREAALGSIRSFIQQRLVQAGIEQLLSLLSPVGAVIQAIIKTYNTIQFFIQRINQILDLVESVVNSIAAIASGAIDAAANFVERTMARTIPVILDFLARFIGLGDIGGQVQQTIQGLQARVDQMLDRAVDWIRRQAQNMLSRLLGGDPNAPPQQRLDEGFTEAQAVVNRYAGRRVSDLLLRPLLAVIRLRHKLTTLEVVPRGDFWVVRGSASPPREAPMPTEALVLRTGARTGIRYFPQNNRARRAEGWLVLGGGHRDSSAQNDISGPVNQHLERLQAHGVIVAERFDAGHLIGDQYGGEGGHHNLVPMESRANRSWFGAFEARVAERLSAGETIHADVSADYDDSNPLQSLIENPSGLPPDMLLPTMNVFRSIPQAIRFQVGRVTDAGVDEVIARVTFDPRTRLALTLNRARQENLLEPAPERARDVFNFR